MLEKKRRYKLIPEHHSEGGRLDLRIAALPGVLGATLDMTGDVLEVRYDLLKVNSNRIEHAIERNDFRLHRRSWWDRVKFGMIHFLEQNERENYLAEPGGCCSGTKRGGKGTCCSGSSQTEKTLQPM